MHASPPQCQVRTTWDPRGLKVGVSGQQRIIYYQLKHNLDIPHQEEHNKYSMSLAITIIGAITAIFGIIILHEFGHFIVARACGITVLRFSIGFGKTLWKWKGKSGTEYVFAFLPLGGYIKMLGEGKEITLPEDARRAYNQKSLLVRMMVVLAGPITNLLLAIIAFWGVYLMNITNTRPVIGEVALHSIAAQANVKSGDELIQIDQTHTKNWQQVLMAIIKRIGDRTKMEFKVRRMQMHTNQIKTCELNLSTWVLNRRNPDIFNSLGITLYQPKISPVIAAIIKDSPAEKVKLQTGDRITAINGKSIKDWFQVVNFIQKKPNEAIQLTVLHDYKKAQVVSLKIGKTKVNDKTIVGYLGILSQIPRWPSQFIYHEKYTILSAWVAAIEQIWHLFKFNLIIILKIIVGKVSVYTLGGPITILQAAGKAAQAGLQVYLGFIGFISFTIGFINFLPIPGLDGGNFLFQVIEGFFRRPLPECIQMIGLTIGMILLIFLMIQATVNDLIRLFFKL